MALSLRENKELVIRTCIDILDDLKESEIEFCEFLTNDCTYYGASSLRINYSDFWSDRFGVINFDHGATRATLICEDFDFVIKIPLENVSTNYNVEENNIYHDLLKNDYYSDINGVFPCTEIFKYNDMDILVQEKATTGDEVISTTFSEWYNGSCDELDLFYDYYGYKVEDLFEEYDINDTHMGNIGVINDRPVLFDFAGYHE